MSYVTEEIKIKEVREVILNNIKFKKKRFSDKELKYKKKKTDQLFLGNAYELVFQIEKARIKKDISFLNSLKANKGFAQIKIGQETLKDTQVIDKLIEWEDKYYKSLKIIANYVKEGKREKLEKAIYFVTFVSMLRTPKNLYSKEKKSKIEEKEIKKFIKKIKKSTIKKVLRKENPLFNLPVMYGELYGEIDIVTKTRLIDIKTTAYPVFTEKMILQLILYYLMVCEYKKEIKEIGIFFSKFNHLEVIKVKKLFKKDGLKNIQLFLEKKYLK